MTNPINDALDDVLRTVRTPGDFCAAGSAAMHLPLIEVDGVGPIALPLLPAQCTALMAAAERAPYGRGAETLLDSAVRRTWQIESGQVRINGRHWPAMLQGVVERAADGLGAGSAVVAELYKLLIYDEGSFFVNHRDTEKRPGMFATLIVALPSLHAGGELVVRHREREARLDLHCADPSEIAWAAFYADCVHEVLPVTSGCRLVLVYSLCRRGKGRLPRPPSYVNETAALSGLLRAWGRALAHAATDAPDKLVYPLEHAYTPAELSLAALKGADAAGAGVLAAAARDAACDLHVALLQIEESGAAEYTGFGPSRYHRRWHDEEDDDDAEFRVGEIIDRSLTLSHWGRADGRACTLGSMPFTEDEVCPADALRDMDPDEQHFEEATGNEGASFERSYQRAALVLWPHARRVHVLARSGLEVSSPALSDLVAHWRDAGAKPGDTTWHEAHALVTQMLDCWPTHSAFGEHESRSAVAQLLAHLQQLRSPELIDAALVKVTLAGAYGKGDNAAIVSALRLLDPARAGELLRATVRAHAEMHVGGVADLMARASAVASWRSPLHGAAKALLEAMPGDPARPKPGAEAWRRERVDAMVVHDALRALVTIDAALANQAVDHWLAWPGVFGLDAVVLPALRRLAGRAGILGQGAGGRLRAAALAHLHARVALELAPPVDWRRSAPVRCECAHCQGLVGFLSSPSQEVWRFKAREDLRSHVEDSIRHGHCDVDCSTERKGSPHVLVCSKNQASYQRRVGQRREDLEDLRRLGA